MLFRFTKLWVAIGLLIALWGLGTVRQSEPRAWVRPIGTRPGPVRIIQFYASVGILTAGDKALLCYGVENARSVRIAPLSQAVYPSYSRCLEIGPDHTTHYTILAEGYDGKVVMKSFTLAVQAVPAVPQIVSEARIAGSIVVSKNAAVSAELPAAPTAAEAGKT
jgi:hypothetical protein